MTISNGTDLSASNSDHLLGRPSIPNLASHHVEQQPSTVTEFCFIRLLALGYLGISVLSIVATVVLRNHASRSTPLSVPAESRARVQRRVRVRRCHHGSVGGYFPRSHQEDQGFHRTGVTGTLEAADAPKP